jgi:hypothetical protein
MLKALGLLMLLAFTLFVLPLLVIPAVAVLFGVAVGLVAAVGGAVLGLLLPVLVIAAVCGTLWLVLHLVSGLLSSVMWIVGGLLTLVFGVLMIPLFAAMLAPAVLPLLVLGLLVWLVFRAARPQPSVPALPAPATSA